MYFGPTENGDEGLRVSVIRKFKYLFRGFAEEVQTTSSSLRTPNVLTVYPEPELTVGGH